MNEPYLNTEDDLDHEQWMRGAEDVLEVWAERQDDDEWPWQVSVAAMEFVRDEPLESELRAAIHAALAGVVGVVGVVEMDREVWLIAGDASGASLVGAVGGAVDTFAERIRDE